MKLKEALDFWISENGFRQIQSLFSKRIHSGEVKYAQSNFLESITNLELAEDAIATIKDYMQPGKYTETYWRGDSEPIEINHIREGFFPVTRDIKKAETYGKLYKVIVDKNVPRISFMAEGDETLLADGMVYTYDGNTVYVRPPTMENHNLQYLGNLYKTKKTAKNKQKQEKLEHIINKIYCYSFEIPNEFGIYEGICDEEILNRFNKQSLSEKYKVLTKRLEDMPNSGEYMEDLHLLLGITKKELKSLLEEITFLSKIESKGGRSYKKKTRKNKKTRK
jgi:hypothetical protein